MFVPNKNDLPGTGFTERRIPRAELWKGWRIICRMQVTMEAVVGFGRGALLWLIGIPLPIILLLALFMHH
jgi:hypothetical protein